MQPPPIQVSSPFAFDPLEKKRLLTRSNWMMGGAVAAFIAFVLCPTTIPPGGVQDVAMAAFGIGSMGLWVFGCGAYTRSKGYSGTYGVLGLLGIVGLVVLLAIPDKWPLPKTTSVKSR